MVAISLYRGNLHRVPDVPRRWLMPKPCFSLKVFRNLLHRRSKALSALSSSAFASTSVHPTASGNPNPDSPTPPSQPSSSPLPSPASPHPPLPSSPPPPQEQQTQEDENPEILKKCLESLQASKHEAKMDLEDHKNIADSDCEGKQLAQMDLVIDSKVQAQQKAFDQVMDGTDGNAESLQAEERAAAAGNPTPEANNKLDGLDEKEKRKREVEEKLQILNAKKHNLVQALRQILNAEEELKRRSSIQAIRPTLPPQVDATNDSGSMTRHGTPRVGSEPHAGGDQEVGEAVDALNHNPQSRHLLRMSSMSPSSESALRRPLYFQHNVVSHPPQAGTVAAASPARFGHPGGQIPPAVSLSGTNYIASSPSPAASGGTSGFRDAQHPSPWK
ncbi:hypothetical protein Nepgr_033366 [Nepenthes gracilis]|uniref:Uncharacterized protein n=1 Tax=Nepenthes gracilis TaxID=150966 RepID=A0AAD3TM95_NEPGR|nr:hypothetical protein Nepgr_033366 [Nepenthes gracilis]